MDNKKKTIKICQNVKIPNLLKTYQVGLWGGPVQYFSFSRNVFILFNFIFFKFQSNFAKRDRMKSESPMYDNLVESTMLKTMSSD